MTDSPGNTLAPQIFISHANIDRSLALLVKEIFNGNLIKPEGGDIIKVFCSSDIGDIEGGKPWFDAIMTALRTSQVCISIMTPNSVHRPWVLFESGGAYSLSIGQQSRSRMFPVCSKSVKNILPGPLSFIQARYIGDKKEVLQLCKEVASIFGISDFNPPNRIINQLRKVASHGRDNWEYVHPCLVGDRLDSSPFSIDALVDIAQSYIFCGGQNLHFLANSVPIKAKLFKWLAKSNENKIDLLLCDPREDDAVNAWTTVGADYPKHLKDSIQIFKGWLTEGNVLGFENRLRIRVTKLVTTSITFIDSSNTNSAFLVLTPVVFMKPFSPERPHFIVPKKDLKQVFDYYWEAYVYVFNNADSVDNIDLST